MTPNDVMLAIADAVVLELNSTEDLSFGPDAERAYVAKYDLKDLADLKTTVVPAGFAATSADRAIRRAYDYSVHVVVQRKTSNTIDDLDALRGMAKEVVDLFEKKALPLDDGREAECVSVVNLPAFDAPDADENRRFRSVITLTFRVAPERGDTIELDNRYIAAALTVAELLNSSILTAGQFARFVGVDEEFPSRGLGPSSDELPAIRIEAQPSGAPRWLTPDIVYRPAVAVVTLWAREPANEQLIDLWDRVERVLDPPGSGADRDAADDALESAGVWSLRVSRPAIPDARPIDDLISRASGQFDLLLCDPDD